MRFFRYTIFYIFIFSELGAYRPLVWSFRDTYILNGKIDGPTSLKVYDHKNNLLEEARYTYNSKGYLLKEDYYKPSGEKTGMLFYDYTKKFKELKKERLEDKDGKKIHTIQFQYNSKSLLEKLLIYNEKNKKMTERKYDYKNQKLIKGEEIKGKEKSSFYISYKNGKKVSIRIIQKKKKLVEIKYRYTKQWQLLERRRYLILQKDMSRYLYHYNPKHRLDYYEYFTKDKKGKWQLEKKYQLYYK